MSKQLSSKEKTQIMANTAKQLVDMIQKRLNNRIEALQSLSEPSIQTDTPDEVKKMREIEAGKIRAVMEEQKNLIEIIKVLFPNA